MPPIYSKRARSTILFSACVVLVALVAGGIWLLNWVFGSGTPKSSQPGAGSDPVVAEQPGKTPTSAPGGGPVEKPVKLRPVPYYETVGISIPFDAVRSNRVANYWEQKVQSGWQITMVNSTRNSTSSRLQKNPVEKQALLAGLWDALVGGGLRDRAVQSFLLSDRSDSRSPSALYVVIADLKGAQGKGSVEVEFIGEQPAWAVIKPGQKPTPTDSIQGAFTYQYQHFPNNDFDRFWTGRQPDQDLLWGWVRATPAGSFGSGVTVGGDSFYVAGNKDTNAAVRDLLVIYLGKGKPRALHPPEGYLGKEFVDLQLERLQTHPHDRLNDRLGGIAGLSSFTGPEQSQVKEAVWQYFQKGTRDAEVDARLSNDERGTALLANLRFQPSTVSGAWDVILRKIGTRPLERGKLAVDLRPATVFGLANASSSPEALVNSWNRRYPARVAETNLSENVTKTLERMRVSGCRNPQWFSDNYGIVVHDRSSVSSRLQSAHGLPVEECSRAKDFLPGELGVLEAVLGTFSDRLIADLRGIHLVRQERYFGKSDPFSKQIERSNKKLAGICRTTGEAKTIAIFDMDDGALFVGDVNHIFPDAAQTYAHEFGHALGAIDGRLEQFNRFTEEQRIAPVTWYAASPRATEFFAESFALFQLHPAWMERNHPKMYEWFRAWARR